MAKKTFTEDLAGFGKCITATSSKKWPFFSGQVQQYRGTELISFRKRFPKTELQRYKLRKKPANLFWQGTAVQRYRANFNLECAILYIEYGSTEVQDTNVQKTTELHRYRA